MQMSIDQFDRFSERVAASQPNWLVKKLGETQLKEAVLTVAILGLAGEYHEEAFTVFYNSPRALREELEASYAQHDQMIVKQEISCFALTVGDLQVTKCGHLIDQDGKEVGDPANAA